MKNRDYRKETRRSYIKSEDKDFTLEELKTGCLLRIADATEKMAGNYTALQDKVKTLQEDKERHLQSIDHLTRSNTALRSYMKRLKKKK